MHVAHVITRLIIGGAQQNTLLTCEEQHREYGDEVTLITGPAIGPEGSLIDRARAAGFRVIELDSMRRSIHPWHDWRSYRDLLAVLRELRPDLVHTHSSKAGIIGRYAAAKLKLPAVHTIHGSAFHFGQHPLAFRLYRFLERRAARWSDHLISVCDSLTDQYVEAGVAPRERFTTVYSGMDVEPFLNPPRSREDVRTELGLTDDQVAIAKVARLFNLKGHEYLIRAARAVADRNANVRFVLIGDGILREQLEQQIADSHLSDHFIFTGLVEPRRIPELINACDIVAHTSVWEGLARVLPQGLISGKPVVSYDVDGAREVVVPNETGFLLPRESITELSAAISALVESPELRERLGSTGRERFTDRFRHQTMTREIREVYKRVLENR
ncbi:MAG: glycosyltransferase family 4 protein [Planctomycetota bacterium]|nr:glycosyltransferase family 4 protein [Planctomycetota bacterium]MDA1248560.1 glycosyltransferase family 4 protein [Planctomycetota bacterium]